MLFVVIFFKRPFSLGAEMFSTKCETCFEIATYQTINIVNSKLYIFAFVSRSILILPSISNHRDFNGMTVCYSALYFTEIPSF